MSTQTMIDAACAAPSCLDQAHAAPVLTAALIAFAEELEALATSTLAANKRGAKGKATIYTEGAALLRGRAAELETHGPITEADRARRDALAVTEAGAERLLENARPNGKDMENLNALVGTPQTESTALQVEHNNAETCGVRDEMGYVCERRPHAPGDGSHETFHEDGSVACRWPDTRDTEQAQIAAYLKGETDQLPDFGTVAKFVDLGPASHELTGIVTALAAPPASGGFADDFAKMATTVMAATGYGPNGEMVFPDGTITSVTIEGTVVYPTEDIFAGPSSVIEGDDPFAVAGDVSTRAPWLLDPQPVPFAFNPATAIGVPDHVSYSQITTGEACGLQLRIKKRDGVKGQPAYWNAGGSAVHACIELIERRRLGLVSYGTVDDVLAGDLAACARLFVHNFDLEIAAAVRESGIPVERWRVGGKGAEGDAWWRHNGALMVHDYVAWSAAKHAEGWAILNVVDKTLGIELELDEPIAHDLELGRDVMLNARIDQVWYRWEPATPGDPDGMPTLLLHIEDSKSGARPVTDTFQLGLYGHVLGRMIDREFPPPVAAKARITASYYDARNGKSGETIDPRAAHSWQEIEYRALTTLGMHSAGIYPANPKAEFGGPCGLCDVRHACPIMAMKE